MRRESGCACAIVDSRSPTIDPQKKGVADLSRLFEFRLKLLISHLDPIWKSPLHRLTGHSFRYRRSLGTDGQQVVWLAQIWDQLVTWTLVASSCTSKDVHKSMKRIKLEAGMAILLCSSGKPSVIGDRITSSLVFALIDVIAGKQKQLLARNTRQL